MKRKISLILAVAVCLSLFAGCSKEEKKPPVDKSSGMQTEQKTFEFKLGTTVQTTMPAGRAAEQFCNDVAEASEGRITIGYYPATQLGTAEELMSQLVDGTLDMAQISLATASGYFEQIGCVQIPFLLTDNESMLKAYQSDELQAIFNAMEEELGVKIIAMAEHGKRVIANNIRPVYTPADMVGIKMRSGQTGACFAALTALGANPMGLTYKEVYSALESKVVDGEEINFTSMYAEAHYEVIKYVTDVVLWPFPAVVIMSGNAWNSLSAEDQALIESCGARMLENNFSYLDEYEAEAKQVLIDAGVQIIEDVDPAPFQELTADIREEYRQKDPMIAAFIAMVENMD